jgi:hypothetical protein
MTKTEALKWARRARRLYGLYKIDAYRVEIACPVDVQRDPGRLGHRVTVWHKAWEKVTAPMIDRAFVEHFCHEYEEERCTALAWLEARP